MTHSEKRRVLETVTGPETLEEIQQILDEMWSAHDIPEQVRMHTDLAVSEIGANIIEHSGDGNPVRLRVEVEVVPDVVRVSFTDDGHPAPVDLSRVEMPDEMSERGRGLAIAFRVLDELSYRRDDEGNHWTLVHRITP
ncbi:MAG TPA: ATP-binding protein [Mycobacterium sp.]